MIITVKKEQIIDGLQKAASIIPTKAGAAYLRSIWLQATGTGEKGHLTIMATDVNIEFTGNYPASVEKKDRLASTDEPLSNCCVVFPEETYSSGWTAKVIRSLSNRDAVPINCLRLIPSGSSRFLLSLKKELFSGPEISFRIS